MIYQTDYQSAAQAFHPKHQGTGAAGHLAEKARWFQIKWPPTLQASHITFKELVPIILAVAVGGHEWAGKSMIALFDNSAVVDVLRKRDSKEPQVMQLMRCWHS